MAATEIRGDLIQEMPRALRSMEFIHLTGKQLTTVVQDDELSVDDLKNAGVADETIVRINRQGDIEVRRPAQWDVVGGLIGDFERRLKGATGLDWA